MNDMTSVIVPKSDQINADDLIGGDMTITIREVQIKGGQEQPVSIYFDGSDKAFRPCKSMSRVLVAAWGPDAKKYVGRTLQLYRDPTVKWGGLEVGGIRIRAMTDIDAPMTMALTATKGSRKPFTVRPLANAPAPAPAGTDAASKWAAWFIGELPKIEDVAGLDALELETAGKLESLKTKRPELHQQATAAADVRRAELALADDDFSTPDGTATGDPLPAEATTPKDAAAPSFEEGPDDTQRGEAPTLDEALAAVNAAGNVIDVNAAVTSYRDQLPEADGDALQARALERVAKMKGGE